MGDPNYAESKAIELISEAKQLAREVAEPPHCEVDDKALMEQYNEKVAQAISLLALARVQRNGALHS